MNPIEILLYWWVAFSSFFFPPIIAVYIRQNLKNARLQFTIWVGLLLEYLIVLQVFVSFGEAGAAMLLKYVVLTPFQRLIFESYSTIMLISVAISSAYVFVVPFVFSFVGHDD